MRIAIVNADIALAADLAEWLEEGDHICHAFHTGAKFIAGIKRETFDLFILDWTLPDTSGIEVMAWARKHISELPPIVFVTSRRREADIVKALDHGADDYIVKPIRPLEFRARVGALMRRSFSTREHDMVDFGGYGFHRQTLCVRVGSEDIVLTPKEFDLALLLFQNLNRSLSRTYILEKVWGRNPDLFTRTLDAHISRIRLKLRLRPEFGYSLLPTYGYGYGLRTAEQEAA